jgi:hypothetical protein
MKVTGSAPDHISAIGSRVAGLTDTFNIAARFFGGE